jgi:hypothetical protein
VDWIDNFKRLMDKPIPLNKACYLMVDQEPPDDIYENVPANNGNLVPQLKPKPFNIDVENFLLRFLEIYASREIPEINERIWNMKFPSQLTYRWKELPVKTWGLWLTHIHNFLRDNPGETIHNPNDFRHISLTIEELKKIALRMGLTPRFLESADLPQVIPSNAPALPVVNSGRELTDLECEMIYRNRFEFGMMPKQIVAKMFPDEPKSYDTKRQRIYEAIKRHKEKLKKKS